MSWPFRSSAATSWAARRDEIEEVCARARSAWPGIALPPASFTAYLDERVPPAATADTVHLGHLYLACACTRGEAAAIAFVDAEFVTRLGPLLPDPEQPGASVDDLLQVVRLRLFFGDDERPARISEYNGVSDLATWIKVVAIRISMGARRRQKAERSAAAEAALDLLADVPSPELSMLKEEYRAEFKAAFPLAFRSLSPRERNVIRLQVLDRLSIDRIAALYGVHRATAARWVTRARAHLVRLVKRRLRQQLDLSRSELGSIMRIIRSQIDVTASAFLSISTER